MNRVMNKKLLSLLLAALMVFMLAACEVSSSSTSTTTVTTSKTDADGNTTTSTTTTEVGTSVGPDGVTTTNQTTTETTTTGADEADDGGWQDLVDRLYATYTAGAEGRNEAGDWFYYGFNDDTDDAILVIISADDQNYSGREGVATFQDDHYVLYSEEMNDETPYVFSEQDENGDFTMTFLGDGDVASMHIVDQDTILQDILARIQEFQ